jgi:hypothetical protein
LNHAVLRVAHPGKDHSVPYRLKHAHHRRGKRAWRAPPPCLPHMKGRQGGGLPAKQAVVAPSTARHP